MTGFLDLPGELRQMIYDLALPTVKKQQTMNYDPGLNLQKQPFLSLWNICDQITAELPLVETLLSSGALIPALDIKLGAGFDPDRFNWEESLAHLIPYLKPARCFLIQTPIFWKNSEHEDILVPDLNTIAAWDAWLEKWNRSSKARHALEIWLDDTCVSKESELKTLYVQLKHVGEGFYYGPLQSLFTALNFNSLRNLRRIVVCNTRGARNRTKTNRMNHLFSTLVNLLRFVKEEEL
ncbi:hypothetical protein MMC10_009101 [Thelotrema lepadinum]|nr:hypothetical protein [Thelotrema lepadinum]